MLDENNIINKEGVYNALPSTDIYGSNGEIYINNESAKMVNEGVNIIVIDIKEKKVIDIKGFDITRIL